MYGHIDRLTVRKNVDGLILSVQRFKGFVYLLILIIFFNNNKTHLCPLWILVLAGEK